MRKRAHIKSVLPLVVLGLCCFGCSSHTRLRQQYAAYSQLDFPQNDDEAGSVDPVYTFGIDDVIEIKFFNNEQFNETLRVRPDGRITLAKVDEIFVLGMTPMQLDSVITAAYAKIIRTPDVTVIVREFGARLIFVLGEVNRPGAYPIHRHMTLLHSIAAAGDFKQSAERRSVMIVRRKNRQTLTAFKIDMTQYHKQAESSRMSTDPSVYSMDIIYVPKSYIASAYDFLKQIYDIVLPPFDVGWKLWYYKEVLRK